MKLRLLSLGWMIFVGCVCLPAWGIEDLELTQGSKVLVPLGIRSIDGNASPAVKRSFRDVISADLSNSGWFRLIDPPSMPTQTWRSLGANALLYLSIDRISSGSWKLRVRLVGLYSANQKPENLLRMSYVVETGHFRSLAHRISDALFEKLTGVRGNFRTHLAYVSVDYPRTGFVTYRLMVSDYDGHAPHALLKSYDPIMSPTWSPDGQYLAYVAFQNHRAQIFIQSLQTGKRKRILAAPGINGSPAFSPNGQHLAVVLTQTGHPKLYDLTLLTGQLRQLTHGNSIDTEPSWSPNGSQLLFTSNRGGRPQIYTYDLPTGRVKRMTWSGTYNARARWLPSGTGFVMMHRGRYSRAFRLAAQTTQDTSLTNLTRPGKIESPSISPNGQMVVYAEGNHLAEVSIDGEVARTLPTQSSHLQEPAWSPFKQN